MLLEIKTQNKPEIIGAFLKFVSNKKKVDKYSIAYYLDMLDKDNLYTLYPEAYKRDELLEKLKNSINENNITRLISSNYAILNINQYL